ncbi:MAG: Zn-ribbon domain-containing OB-fold protein [Dehalococcoidia bacterium]
MAGQEYQRPIPTADEASAPFFAGAKQHKLMLQRCSQCGSHRLPGRERCQECWSEASDWVQASGRGKLYTYGIMHQQYHPAFADITPYNYALVELEEGPRLITNVVDCANEDLRTDMPLEAVFDDVSDETTLIRFRPAANSHQGHATGA